MATKRRTSTSYSTGSTTNSVSTSTRTADRLGTSGQIVSTSNPFYTTGDYATTISRPRTVRRSTGRPSTARPRTGVSTLGAENQEIICAVSESRGISPTVGLAFINLDTGEAVLSQICDSQTYVRTIHKLTVFNPTNILIMSTAASPKSKLFSIIEDSLDDLESMITLLDRRYWAETTGIEYIQQLAFAEDVESIKTAVSGNYYAVCCFAAVLKYIELGLSKTFPLRSLRIKYEPSEGSMLIDLSTMHSLELVQNLQNAKSKDCLFGLLNETLTPMGGRLLRGNILQPLTNPDTLGTRYDALEELSTKEEMFFAVRQALKPVLDVDKILTQLILVPLEPSVKDTEQAINNVIMLKEFLSLVKPVFEALVGSRCSMLQEIRALCTSEKVEPILMLIDEVINEDTTYAKQPLDLRNQRTYAVKSGVNGLLDVARQTYKEGMTDALQHIADLDEEHGLSLQRKFDNTRQFYLRLKAEELEQRDLPAVFINVFRKKDIIECQTLDLLKRNGKIASAHTEVLLMSDKAIQELISNVREHMSILFKICEAIGMLDMLASFAQVVTSQDYIRPQITETLGVRNGRHPIREKIHHTKFIPNDVYATQQTRFQIITGCNMSGKSTYIRSVALMTVMAQIGCFVPAQYAVFPIIRQLFARISMDDNIEANVSTFAAEMRETAFILRNIDRQSMVIIDELGRGTSTRDGLGIAIAIAEALVESRALVWFATHFRDLANIMSERNGVVNLHLAVDMSEQDKMNMLYRIEKGSEQEEHYGLKLARVVPLPVDVVEHAEHVAKTLERQVKRKQKRSPAIIQARRRKLLLNLKEHLIQAKNGKMDDETLKEWLKDLQKEFVIRMSALDDEAQRAEMGLADDEDEGGGDEMDDVPGEARRTTAAVDRELEQHLQNQTYRDSDGIDRIDATENDSQTSGHRTFSEEL
ncbi:MutS protein msh4 [Vermiconidia calcicola]|uniref:MutS protein msh4 n=1 Tax=Vermiconidia calcicola TaxID=1690605 RepID=A0ACC3NNW2_9PEZI|nr:MutS protein msh4 [Vermiconidia calcicola]